MHSFAFFPIIASIEMMVEVYNPFNLNNWLRPSTERSPHGDWLAWFGPFHIALGRVSK